MSAVPAQGAAAPPGSLMAELADPCFFLVDFDFEEWAAVFSRVQPEWFQAKLRLSAYDLPLESLSSLPLDLVLGALPQPPSNQPPARATNYLFHLPFCGSSFLTRHLEHDQVLLLRDPASLDAVFRKQPGREYPARINELRHATLVCLNRQLGGRTTVVRTAGYYPQMLGPLLGSATCRAGVLLYSSAEHYLLQVLKSAERRRHVRLLMTGELAFVAEKTGQLLDTLTDVAVAALFWIRFIETVLAIARAPGNAPGHAPGRARLRTLDCEQLFADPDHALARVSDAFGISRSSPSLARAQQVRSTHAKTGESFSTDQRALVLEQARTAYASELLAAEELLAAANASAMLAELGTMSI